MSGGAVGVRRLGRRCAGIVAALAADGATATLLAAPAAQAAPSGPVDAGVPLSSAVYGTNCTYPLTVPVNSSGWVTFWEIKPGLPPRFLGRDLPSGALASVTWVPRRIGDKCLVAVQNGQASKPTPVRVRQGHGSGGACIAF